MVAGSPELGVRYEALTIGAPHGTDPDARVPARSARTRRRR